jgi:hypothetical protein
MLDIHHLMSELARSRPVFHSEADFQHALAWQIREAMPDCSVRLEFKPFPDDDKRMYLDIWLPTVGVAIELKYPTRKLELNHNDEYFSLADHSAQDIQRYDFLKDLQRLENVVARHQPAKAGYAVLLTNDSGYWNVPQNANTIDSEFRLHEGRTITGRLAWSERAGRGTTRNREKALEIQRSYDLHWRDYSAFGRARNERFRYLAVPVTPSV